MHPLRVLRDERGIAIITVLLVALAIGSIAIAAALVSTNASLINRYYDRQSTLVSAADAGLEQARSMVNGTKALYPGSGYTTLENGVPVRDASGAVIPNVKRYLYVGPTGVTSGQYGVFGSVVSVVEDAQGNNVVRRAEVVQESFAKFAYFTDVEPSNIAFGNGDAIYGPVHTNDTLKIYSSGATFYGPVTTGKVVKGAQYGTFKQSYVENAPLVPMPATADLTKLKAQGQAGYLSFVTPSAGGSYQSRVRIEFVAVDLDTDGDVTDANEGFIKVYEAQTDAGWVMPNVPQDFATNQLKNSENCGDYHGTAFVRASKHPSGGHDYLTALKSATRRCYLGGADALFGSFQASSPSTGLWPNGWWQPWPGPVIDHPVLQARPDGKYLWPINRALNPSFKGVIYVEGKIAVSGVVRGQVTLAATDNILIADDITYATNPGAGTCTDMLGLFSGTNVVLVDNLINSPAIPEKNGTTYYTFDDTKDEFVHAVVLALNNFTVENYSTGSTNAEPCESTARGRGCLYLTGGIIQRQRGPVGLTDGRGYLKRYSYDACAFSNSPPYFPTTGHFARGRYYEVDPTAFSVSALYELLTP